MSENLSFSREMLMEMKNAIDIDEVSVNVSGSAGMGMIWMWQECQNGS